MTSWADLQPIDKVDSFEKKAFTDLIGLVLQIFFSVLEVIKRRFNKFNFHYVLRFMQDVLSLLVCSNDKTGLQVGMKLEIIV